MNIIYSSSSRWSMIMESFLFVVGKKWRILLWRITKNWWLKVGDGSVWIVQSIVILNFGIFPTLIGLNASKLPIPRNFPNPLKPYKLFSTINRFTEKSTSTSISFQTSNTLQLTRHFITMLIRLNQIFIKHKVLKTTRKNFVFK